MATGLNIETPVPPKSKESRWRILLNALDAVWSYFSFSYAGHLIAQGKDGSLDINSAQKWHPKDLNAKSVQHKFERIYASRKVYQKDELSRSSRLETKQKLDRMGFGEVIVFNGMAMANLPLDMGLSKRKHRVH